MRSDSAAEQTSRTLSIVDTSAGSRGNASTKGQSARCTERPPVSPRQTSSAVIGASGATTFASVSRTVYSVSNASVSPVQNRSRDRRTYQFVSASRYERTEAHAPATS